MWHKGRDDMNKEKVVRIILKIIEVILKGGK